MEESSNMINFERRRRIQNAQRRLEAHIEVSTYLKKRLDESAELLEEESRLDDHLTAIENRLEGSTLLESHVARFSTVARGVTLRSALICRLPNEILREVLTIAIYDRVSRPRRTEHDFAGVCGLWRQIMLDIRWPHFHISFLSPPARIDAMWDFVSQRLTYAPRCLDITGVHSRESGLLVSKQLGEISTLHKVQISLDSTHFPQVFRDSFQCSELSLIDLLEIGSQPPFPLAETLASAQGVQRLYIRTDRPIELQAVDIVGFGSVVDLTFVELDALQLDSLLRAVPSLKKLQLERIANITLEVGEGQIPLVSTISTLALRQVDTEWTTHLRCPDLKSLALDLYHQSSLVAFISRSPLLKSLTVYAEEQSFDLDILVPYCQRIEYLEINRLYPVIGEWQEMGLPTPSFPNLKTLNFGLMMCNDLSVYRNLISARCLPDTNPHSTRPPGLRPVELLFSEWENDNMMRFIETDKALAGATREMCWEIRTFSDDEEVLSVFKWT